MGSLLSINVSATRGVPKQPSSVGRVTSLGIEGDAHAGSWHRQVSVLARESTRVLAQKRGRDFSPGDFAENLTTEGLDLSAIAMLDRIEVGPAELEVTQIGKRCHGPGCAIARELGECVMPSAGIFCRVTRPGTVRTGDPVRHIAHRLPIAIITVSDRVHRSEYEDRSGPRIRERLQRHFGSSQWRTEMAMEAVVPDEAADLRRALKRALASYCRVLFTTGGTGLGPRDITVDVLQPMLDRVIPGVMEGIRMKYGLLNPNARLSRSIAGTIGSTLVYALPGSPGAIEEYLDEILPTLDHSLRMLAGLGHG